MAGAASLALHGAGVWLLIARGLQAARPSAAGSAVTPIAGLERAQDQTLGLPGHGYIVILRT